MMLQASPNESGDDEGLLQAYCKQQRTPLYICKMCIMQTNPEIKANIFPPSNGYSHSPLFHISRILPVCVCEHSCSFYDFKTQAEQKGYRVSFKKVTVYGKCNTSIIHMLLFGGTTALATTTWIFHAWQCRRGSNENPLTTLFKLAKPCQCSFLCRPIRLQQVGTLTEAKNTRITSQNVLFSLFS